MPIDPAFPKTRPLVGHDDAIAVWGPLDPPGTLGIRGTYVAVDWDLCTGCSLCLTTCPHQVYAWRVTPGHPTSPRKAFPLREAACVQCYRCEAQCPRQAIRITYPGLTGWSNLLAWLTFLLVFLQPLGGFLYGVIAGPALGLWPVFYGGWAVLGLGVLLVVAALHTFRTQGKTVEGRDIMATTVLVESGPYGLVRHPQFLGVALVACAAILVSQHWVFAALSLPLLGPLLTKWIHEAEANLLAKFGEDYQQYMTRVPRLNLVEGIRRRLRQKGTPGRSEAPEHDPTSRR